MKNKKRTPQSRAFSLATRRKKPKINLLVARIFDGLAAMKEGDFEIDDIQHDFNEWKERTINEIKSRYNP